EGFYLGGNVGYGSANRTGCSTIFNGGIPDCSVSDTSYPLHYDYDQTGWLAGGQVGVNHVLGGALGGHSMGVGAEVAADLSGVTGELHNQFPGYNGTGDWNWLATGMAKLGLVSGNWMLYGQGGIGLGGFSYNSAACNFSTNNQGWAYGAGVAVASG